MISEPRVEAFGSQVVVAALDHRATHYVMRAALMDTPTVALLEGGQWLVALESGWHGERGTWAILRDDESHDWRQIMDLFGLEHDGDREGYTALFRQIGIEVMA